MGVADVVYDAAMVESVLFRSTGVSLSGMQYGSATNPATRNYRSTGRGIGHVYMHTADREQLSGLAGTAHKSRFQDKATVFRKIRTVALNMRAHGDALFITSVYPDQCHA